MSSMFELFLMWCEEFFNTDFLYTMQNILSQKVDLGTTSVSVLSLTTFTGLGFYLVVAVFKWVFS